MKIHFGSSQVVSDSGIEAPAFGSSSFGLASHYQRTPSPSALGSFPPVFGSTPTHIYSYPPFQYSHLTHSSCAQSVLVDPWELQQVSEIRSLCHLAMEKLDNITFILTAMNKRAASHSLWVWSPDASGASWKTVKPAAKKADPISKPVAKIHDTYIDNLGPTIVDLEEIAEHPIVIPMHSTDFGVVQEAKHDVVSTVPSCNLFSSHLDTKNPDVNNLGNNQKEIEIEFIKMVVPIAKVIYSLFDENINQKTHYEEWKTLFVADNVFDGMFGKFLTIMYEIYVDKVVDILLERNFKRIFEKVVFVFDPGGGTNEAEDGIASNDRQKILIFEARVVTENKCFMCQPHVSILLPSLYNSKDLTEYADLIIIITPTLRTRLIFKRERVVTYQIMVNKPDL